MDQNTSICIVGLAWNYIHWNLEPTQTQRQQSWGVIKIMLIHMQGLQFGLRLNLCRSSQWSLLIWLVWLVKLFFPYVFRSWTSWTVWTTALLYFPPTFEFHYSPQIIKDLCRIYIVMRNALIWNYFENVWHVPFWAGWFVKIWGHFMLATRP